MSNPKLRAAKAFIVRHVNDADMQEGTSVNLTKLAEEGAYHVDCDEWLDDPNHAIWDLALDAAIAAGRLN